MSLNIGKKLLIVLVVVAAMFAAQSVLDGNVALAAGPGEVNIAGWPLCPGMKYAREAMGLKIYNPDTTPAKALSEPSGNLGFITFNGNDDSGLFGGSFGMTGEGQYTVVMIAGKGRVANTVKLYENTDQTRPADFCSGPSIGIEPAAPPPTDAGEEVAAGEVVTTTVTADAAVRTDVDPCARMRKGPGVDYEKVTCLAPGKELSIIGKNADGSWIQVSSNAGKGWVAAELLTVNVDLDKVAVVEVAPLPAEVAAGVVVTSTTIVTTVTPTIKSLCDRCWEIQLEASVVTETVTTAAKLNRPITLTAESVVIVSADGEAELLVYVENTTVLEPSGSTSILVTKTASVKDRGVKIIARKGDSVLNLWQKVYGPNATPPTLQDIINLATTNGTTFNVGFDDAGNPVFTVIEGTQLLFTCNAA